MSRPADHSHSVRSVQLPSGKTIEIVYFPDDAVGQVGRGNAPAHPQDEPDLQHCAACEDGLVHPTAWGPVGGNAWEVTLRCPNCEHERTGVFPGPVVARFDDDLDRGAEAMLDDLRKLVHANMEEDVERFCRALHAGAVLPEDF